MYSIYKRIVLGEDADSRNLDTRVTRTLGVGQHSVRIRHVDIVGNTARLWLVNQFDEVHTEPVPILDGDDRISWTCWRLLMAITEDRTETFRARTLLIRNPELLEQLVGVNLTVHVTQGQGYSVVRGANDRYWPVLMPDRTRLGQDTYASHDEAQHAAECAGHTPSQFIVGRWDSSSVADNRPFRFEEK